MTLDPPTDPSLSAAVTEAPGLEITHWRDSEYPELNGERLWLEQFELSRSLAITPDGQQFVLGADWSVRLFDRDGQQKWKVKGPNVAWGVNVSRDGRFVVVAYGDGTLRWYGIEDGQERLALFLHADGENWVAWLPEGFFAASHDGENLIGYLVNNGGHRIPDFVRASQLGKQFYRPDLVLARLAGREEQIRAALSDMDDIHELLARIKTPKIERIGSERIVIDSTEFVHKFRVAKDDADQVRAVYRINGTQIRSAGGRTVQDGRPGVVFENQLTLDIGCTSVEVRVERLDGSLESEPVEQEVCVEADQMQKPRLFGLLIGISDYYDGALALNHASTDAERLHDALKARAEQPYQGQKIYEDVHFTLLPDARARRQDVVAALQELAQKVEPRDTFILYMAGHGFTEDGRYHFVPQDAAFANRTSLVEASLNEDDLIGLLTQINTTRSLVLLDTCYGGAFKGLGETQLAFATRGIEHKSSIDRFMRQSGRAVLAASTDVQTALEGYEHGEKKYGLFTWVLLKGLVEADEETGDRNGLVGVIELHSYLAKHVPNISKDYFGRRQIPMGRVEGSFEFVVAD